MEVIDNNFKTKKDSFQDRIVKEGMDLWKKQKEFQRQKKLLEQREMRELLEKYWPFGRGEDAKPRGLRNLRLEELFPNKDYLNAKRFVGTTDYERGGGGAPIMSGGRKITKTKEDPLLRFQFGSKDLRRCVDNTLRYKTDKQEQNEYKKELDQLVEEKKKRQQMEKSEDVQFHKEQFLKPPPWGKQGPGGKLWRKPNTIGLNFLKSLGWSTENTLKQLESTAAKNKANDAKKFNNLKHITLVPPNKIIKSDPIAYPRKKPRKLSPLSGNKDEGVELVKLLAKDRKYPPKIPLCSSDVTSDKKYGTSIWSKQGSAYLRELAQQMIQKQQHVMEMKAKENETAIRHFSTLDGFWGRPGNGAPMEEFKKRSLDRLLYPKITPIGVH